MKQRLDTIRSNLLVLGRRDEIILRISNFRFAYCKDARETVMKTVCNFLIPAPPTPSHPTQIRSNQAQPR